jgi:DNA-binding SARP family transcriptional activator
VAAPTGQGADIPLIALVTALASARAPEDLGLVVVARPHTLPDEIGVLPHGLEDTVDPADPQAVQRALESVQLEVERRQRAASASDADLVVVVRELCELEPEAQQLLGAIAATGPDHGVRLLVASERPVAEVLSRCPFIDQLGTRLVLQTATEDDSVGLLGMPGADRLGAGGHALLRLEGRLPLPGWARWVPADRLARLVHMMGTRAPAVPTVTEETSPTGTEPVELVDSIDSCQQAAPEEAVAGPVPVVTQGSDRRPATGFTASRLLARLRAAPIRVRCFGAGQVWHGDQLLVLGDPEILLLLAVHPIAGIKSEAVVDMLWDKLPPDPVAALRKVRYNLRQELHRLVPEITVDPVPANAYQGEKVVGLDTSVVTSDVHEFTELLECAAKLEPPAAIEAYEAALALYRGDLLDGTEVVNYRWMYDGESAVALGLRSDLRRRQREARLRLAQLLVDGPESGLDRAEELYWSLCAEDPEDERLWTALFRIHQRTGSSLGLEYAVRRLRSALAEIATDEVADVESVSLPPNLDRLLQQIRQRIGTDTVPAS